ncbi:MAG: TlpA family protein disulfide reductase [Planctomycetes bacterium]|nr:TlpA family protein disulfide reductase [Planctomycetota bacterium]
MSNRRMFWVVPVLLLGAAVVVAGETAELGGVVADLKWKSLDGKEVSLGALRKTDKEAGKVVVVHFWSYKCPSGKRILDEVKAMAEACEKNGMAFIGVCAYGESEAELKAFAEKNGISYTLCCDEGKTGTNTLGAKVVTATYVLDREGKLVYRGGWAKAMDAAGEANEGKEVSVKETKPAG